MVEQTQGGGDEATQTLMLEAVNVTEQVNSVYVIVPKACFSHFTKPK